MLKIIIADDNKVICDSLQMTIDWAGLGYEIVATAYDGEEAYQKALIFQPDVLMTDIKMPCLNGLDLIEAVAGKLPNCKFIIISGYGKFEFAQRAINLAVSGFILKPIDNRKIIEVLQKIAAAPGQPERAGSVQQPASAKYLETSAIKNEFRKGLSSSAEVCFPFSYSIYVIITFRGDIPPGHYNFGDIPYEDTYNTVFCDMDSHLCCGLFIGPNINKSAANTLSVRIAEKIIGQNSGKVNAGISPIMPSSVPLSEAYAKSLEALDNLFFCPELRYYSLVSHPSAISKEIWDLPASYFHTLETLLESADLTPILIQETIAQILNGIPKNPALIKQTVVELCLTCRFLLKSKNPLFLDNEESLAVLFQGMKEILSYKAALVFASEYIYSIYEKNLLPQSDFSPQVKKVISYLNEHYSEKIYLQDISEYVDISQSHLSRLIKKETGENFVDLLNSIRINKSVRLIKSGNYRLYEVANCVGIPNYAYFYQLFKKYIGISPTDLLNSV